MADQTINAFEETIRRRAIVFDIGGFRPSENPKASWFGRITWSSPSESWPITDGRPLHPLAQINLTELPYRPPRLDDIAFLTIFIDPEHLPNDEPNGTKWCLRAYRNLDDLVPLVEPKLVSRIRSFQMKPKIIEADYPTHDDIPVELPAELKDSYYDRFSNTDGLKLGGWPTLIQSEIFWAPWNQHPISPEYVFQIDSTEKGNWQWGDAGIGYFGRGTVEGQRDEWAISWQCY